VLPWPWEVLGPLELAWGCPWQSLADLLEPQAPQESKLKPQQPQRLNLCGFKGSSLQLKLQLTSVWRSGLPGSESRWQILSS
jgi:hypothetical protein